MANHKRDDHPLARAVETSPDLRSPFLTGEAVSGETVFLPRGVSGGGDPLPGLLD